MKPSTQTYFRAWELNAIGYGYGTGEPHTFAALKRFFSACTAASGSYDYQALEAAAGPEVAWLLISILNRVRILDYGTSPRAGWLTEEGKALRDYVNATPLHDLLTDGKEGKYDEDECWCSTHAPCQSWCANPFFYRGPVPK